MVTNLSKPIPPLFGNQWLGNFFNTRPQNWVDISALAARVTLSNPSGAGLYNVVNMVPVEEEGSAVTICTQQ